MLSRIECIVDDKQVGTALRALAGLAKEPPRVTPVINAVARGGKVVAETPAGSQLELFKLELDKMPAGANVRRADLSVLLTKWGGNPSSGGGILRQAVKLGWLKQNGKGKGNKVSYHVMRGAAK